jgi:hypothetical protein
LPKVWQLVHRWLKIFFASPPSPAFATDANEPATTSETIAAKVFVLRSLPGVRVVTLDDDWTHDLSIEISAVRELPQSQRDRHGVRYQARAGGKV